MRFTSRPFNSKFLYNCHHPSHKVNGTVTRTPGPWPSFTNWVSEAWATWIFLICQGIREGWGISPPVSFSTDTVILLGSTFVLLLLILRASWKPHLASRLEYWSPLQSRLSPVVSPWSHRTSPSPVELLSILRTRCQSCGLAFCPLTEFLYTVLKDLPMSTTLKSLHVY